MGAGAETVTAAAERTFAVQRARVDVERLPLEAADIAHARPGDGAEMRATFEKWVRFKHDGRDFRSVG